MERKLATIRTIKEILPHPNGDAIELAIVDGWQAIVKKGDFQAGDTVVYFEIDSWVPTSIASFLSNGKTPRVFNGVSGERLRTKRLRGELSQGLVMHATAEVLTGSYYQQALNFNPGMDVTELFGIQKWERKLPACLTGVARGNFPEEIPKTAEARCLDGNTVINTNAGPLPIKDIVDKKLEVEVESFNHATNEIEMKKVVDWISSGSGGEWVTIKLASGKTIDCTTNHKIWCENRQQYVEVSELSVNDTVVVKK